MPKFRREIKKQRQEIAKANKPKVLDEAQRKEVRRETNMYISML